MPTDFRLARLQCNLDIEQDPEVWSCSWIGTERPSGNFVGHTEAVAIGDPVDEEIDNWATDNEYTLL